MRDEEADPAVRAGALLVATPALDGSFFERSVILLLDHDEDGALGVVLNKPSEVPVSQVMPEWHDLAGEPRVLFAGGPVSTDGAMALGRTLGTEEPLGWRSLTSSMGLLDLDTPPPLVAADLAGLRVFAGYAGWSGGQLEDEVIEGSWWTVPAEPADPFSAEPERLWRQVLRRQASSLAMMSTYPPDPSRN
ncbi:MAG: YqgE/AlgH family protein [Actinomycetes bacterium]